MEKYQILTIGHYETFVLTQKLGYPSVYAEDFDQALSLTREVIPDIILLNKEKVPDWISDFIAIIFSESICYALLSVIGGYQTENIEYGFKALSYHIKKPGVYCHEESTIPNDIEPVLEHLDKAIKAQRSDNVKKVLARFEDMEVKLHPFLEQAFTFVIINISQETLNYLDLSKHLNCDKSTINRKLNALTGFAGNGFILFIRLQYVKKLLLSTYKPIKEITYEVGFINPRRLTQEFTKMYGMSPSKFRQQQHY